MRGGLLIREGSTKGFSKFRTLGVSRSVLGFRVLVFRASDLFKVRRFIVEDWVMRLQTQKATHLSNKPSSRPQLKDKRAPSCIRA